MVDFLSGVGSLLQGASSIFGRNSYAGSRKQMRDQYLYNVMATQDERNYNHPAMQMARYREAGINPNAVFGQISSGESALTPLQTASGNSSRSDVFSGLSDIAKGFSNYLSKKEQKKLFEDEKKSMEEEREFNSATKALNLQIQREQLRALQIRNNNSILGNIPVSTRPISEDLQQPTVVNPVPYLGSLRPKPPKGKGLVDYALMISSASSPLAAIPYLFSHFRSRGAELQFFKDMNKFKEDYGKWAYVNSYRNNSGSKY